MFKEQVFLMRSSWRTTALMRHVTDISHCVRHIFHQCCSVYEFTYFTITKPCGVDALGLPRWLSGKESACSVGDAGNSRSIPGLGRSPGGGHGNPLQYSCLENPMDRQTWQATVYEVVKSRIGLKQLRMNGGINVLISHR